MRLNHDEPDYATITVEIMGKFRKALPEYRPATDDPADILATIVPLISRSGWLDGLSHPAQCKVIRRVADQLGKRALNRTRSNGSVLSKELVQKEAKALEQSNPELKQGHTDRSLADELAIRFSARNDMDEFTPDRLRQLALRVAREFLGEDLKPASPHLEYLNKLNRTDPWRR